MYKQIQRVVGICLGILVVGTASAEPITIKLANYFAIDHSQNVALKEKFKPYVEQKSQGALKVDIFENNKLGNELQFYTSVRNGTVEMSLQGMIMQGDVPKMGVPEWPFLFRDIKHAKAVLQGPIGKELTDSLEQMQGVHALAWSVNGIRMISSNRPISKMQDFKGLRLRMPAVPVYVKVGQALGANVSPMPLSEVFAAMEQKVVDGQDNPIATVRASGFYEVQGYILESRHSFSPNVMLISRKLWTRLSTEQKKILEDAAKAYADYQWELADSGYEEDKKFLMGKGMKFITPDAAFAQQMEAVVQPVFEDYYAKYPWAKELVARIKATK